MRTALLLEARVPGDGYDGVIETVTAADRLGLDALWLDGEGPGAGRLGSASILLGALARVTRQLRLGSFRTLPLEHPVRTAEEVAMLDLLSGGRALLGATAGRDPEAYAARAITFAERQERLGEALDLIQAAWAGDEIQYRGRTVRFPSHLPAGRGELARRHPDPESHRPQWERQPETPEFLTVTPKPLQVPGPRVWVLAEEDGEVELAGRRGCSIALPEADGASLRRRAGELERVLQAVGRRRCELDVAVIAPLDVESFDATATLRDAQARREAAGATQLIWRIGSPIGRRLGEHLRDELLPRLAREVLPALQA